jgi:hypothetical protein
MPRSILFWVLVILWGLSILGVFMSPTVIYYTYGNRALEFVLIALLGWQVYGPALKG